jgi:hypothetical protein
MYERYISSAKFTAISCQVCPHLLLGVSAGILQRALVDESGMIITYMGIHNTEFSRSVWDALYSTTPYQ